MTHPISQPNSDGLVVELDQLEKWIPQLELVVTELKARRALIESSLDEMTRPIPQPGPDLLHPATSQRPQLIPMGYVYRGRPVRCWDKTSIYLGVMREVFTDFPDKQEAVAAALAAHGQTRSYISRTRNALYTEKSDEWINRHCDALVPGWFIDKNLCGGAMRTNIRRAVAAVGLTLGHDVVINWRARWA
ncbi:MAG: hypothetical protein ACOZDY_13290 [Pseudomonadota bacterium]